MLTKIIAAVIAIVAFRRIRARYRKGGTLFELAFWGLVFSSVAVAAFFPQWTDKLATWMGISSGFHALTFLAVSALLLVAFRLIGRVKELERQMTLLVRAEALATAQQVPAKPDDGAPPLPSREGPRSA
ncbi:MAG TPA: DUF2304 domain-containing protein [Polyangia bacterium]